MGFGGSGFRALGCVGLRGVVGFQGFRRFAGEFLEFRVLGLAVLGPLCGRCRIWM